jgi:hypothetical protein
LAQDIRAGVVEMRPPHLAPRPRPLERGEVPTGEETAQVGGAGDEVLAG